MAEGARLESVFRGNSNVGSNPTLSASSGSIRYDTIGWLSCNTVQMRRGPQPLSTARRECKAGHPEQHLSSEFEERKHGWKRCECPIVVSGSLRKKFKRVSTGQCEWAPARIMAERWGRAGSWNEILLHPNLSRRYRPKRSRSPSNARAVLSWRSAKEYCPQTLIARTTTFSILKGLF